MSVAQILLRLLVVFATLWQLAIADSNNCSSSVLISSQSDADHLGNCDTVDGGITIASSVSGTITLNNIEKIKGSLTAEGSSGLTGLIAPDLDTLQGALTLDSLGLFTNLTMNALSGVCSGITITGNPKFNILRMEELAKVDGQLKLIGTFSSVLLPSLDEVNGETTIRGSSSMSCSALDNLQTEGARRHRKHQTTPPMVSISPSTVVSDEKQPSPHDQLSPLPGPKPPVPRKPLGPTAAQLDSRSIYEVPTALTPVCEYHELDAGPVLSSHQRPIHSEA